MRKCIYTYRPLNINVPADDNTESKEHIIPYALGGSDAFVTYDCSKKSNNDFGRDIDAPFIKIPFVGFKRHELSIKGYGGDVPDIEMKASITDINKEGVLIFPYNDEPYVDTGIEVGGGILTGKMSFGGSPDRVKRAVADLIKKANRKGLQVMHEDLTPVFSANDISSKATAQNGKEVHVNLKLGIENFFEPWAKGIFKIVLGLGHTVLGEDWTFSPSGDKVRMTLVKPFPEWQHIGIKGSVMCQLPDEIKFLLRIKPNVHTLGVLPYENRMIAVVSLFGGETFDAIIDMGDDLGNKRVINDTLPKDLKMCFHIDLN